MKITINFDDWVERFKEYNRYNQYSYEGHKALFDYLDNLSDELGEDTEFDVVAICCEWSEYTEEELIDDYNYLLDDADFNEEIEVITRLLDALHDRTTVITVESVYNYSTHERTEETYIIRDF